MMNLSPKNIRKREAVKLLVKSILIPMSFAIFIGVLLNQISQAPFFRSLAISSIYAFICGLIVVFPFCVLEYRLNRVRKMLLTFVLLVPALTLIGTSLAEILLSATIYQKSFVLFGPGHMFWLNLLLSSISISICSWIGKIESSSSPGFIQFRTSKGIQILRASDIFFIYAKNKYTFVNTVKAEFLADKTLKSFATELPAEFTRVSRSHIINSSKIARVNKNNKGKIRFYLSDKNRTEIPAGVTFQKGLKKQLFT